LEQWKKILVQQNEKKFSKREKEELNFRKWPRNSGSQPYQAFGTIPMVLQHFFILK